MSVFQPPDNEDDADDIAVQATKILVGLKCIICDTPAFLLQLSGKCGANDHPDCPFLEEVADAPGTD